MKIRHVLSVLKRSIHREGGPYECCGCGERFAVEYYSCPKCESYFVERVEWGFNEDTNEADA